MVKRRLSLGEMRHELITQASMAKTKSLKIHIQLHTAFNTNVL